MEELLGESRHATGSLAVDQGTLDVKDDRSESGSDDSFTAEVVRLIRILLPVPVHRLQTTLLILAHQLNTLLLIAGHQL